MNEVHELLDTTQSDLRVATVTHARRAAARVAAETGHDNLSFDLELVVSELVTNAMLHGGGCTGARIVTSEDHLRVEVSDGSSIPPLLGHATEGSLTGRGMRLVAKLAAKWGVDPTPDGKVIWAELSEAPPVSDQTAADLLDMWAEEWADDLAVEHIEVELGDVPTRLLLAAKSHVDNLVREFTLSTTHPRLGDTDPANSDRLLELLAVVDGFREPRIAIKHQALAAHGRGEDTTHLVLDVPVDAADAAQAYLDALRELDAYCRAGRLLTLETPPQHRIFREWYIGELIEQLRARKKAVEPPAPTPFLERLLAEIDRIDAAQHAAQRTSRLYALASALAAAATPEQVAAAVLAEGVAALGASGGGVLLAADDDRLWLPGAVGYGDDLVARLRSESPDAALPAAYALRSGDSVWVETQAERDERFPELVGLEPSAMAMCAVPLEVQRRRLGAVRFSFPTQHLFDDAEREFVLALAALCAQALDRAALQQRTQP